MGKDVSGDAREASTDLAESFLGMIEGAATTAAELTVVEAFRVYRDRVPKVGFSGSAKTGASGGATAGELFFGTEFGSDRFPQFPSRSTGYFFYPTLRAEGPELADDWFEDVFDLMADTWNRGARAAA